MANLIGSIENDSLNGTPETDLIVGFSGNDTLNGNEGGDLIYAGRGNDLVLGENGNDILFGGLGTDTLTGGEGKDRFAIGRRINNTMQTTTGGPTLADADIITDFVKGEDFIGLESDLTFDELEIIQGTDEFADSTIIRDTITGDFLAILPGVSSSDINIADFTKILQPPGPYSGSGEDPETIDSGIPGFIGADGAGKVTPNNSVNPIFVDWATGFVNYQPTPGVDVQFAVPENALGPVTANTQDIVSLGELELSQINDGVSPGEITLTFDSGIRNGDGADFAVFENGFNFQGGLFGELAYVEVSSDGVNFARFASDSLTEEPITGEGQFDPTNVYNLAGKHSNNNFEGEGELVGASFGTPFDLETLANDPLVTQGLVDLDNIEFVRVVDIPGSGDFVDAAGNPIYDPFPTPLGPGGFDLEAVGVINANSEETTAIEWIAQLGSSGWDESFSVAADSSGNVYLTGLTSGDLGGTQQGIRDVFVAKYDTDGSLLWTQQLGSAGYDEGLDIAADSDGNVYVTGETWGDLGGTNQGSNDAFLAKYDSDGSLLWTQQLGTSEFEEGNGVVADSSGNVYITGYTRGDLVNDGQGDRDRDAFIAKYDDEGMLLWIRQLGSSLSDESLGIATDGNDNLYISGRTSGDLEGSQQGNGDAFVAKYDAEGTLQWTQQLGSPAGDESFDVAADSNGNVYITGRTLGDLGGTNQGSNDAFIAKYDTDGTLQWTQQLGSSAFDYGYSAVTDSIGDVYITGWTNGDLGGTNQGSNDAFLAKYDGDGTLLWTEQLGSSTTEFSFGIAADSSDNLYISGRTWGDLGGENQGITDAWVAKFSQTDVVPTPANPYSGSGEDPGKIDSGIPGFIGADGAGKVTPNNSINPIFVAWAAGFVNYQPAPGVDVQFAVPENALGPVTANSQDIVSLGELESTQIEDGVSPGEITLTFDSGIRNGEGADFAVFENGFNFMGGIFGELAYVEVSSDGVNFARFNSDSLTDEPISAEGVFDPTGVYNLAGKHTNNNFEGEGELVGASFGTPFDLETLANDPLVTQGLVDLNNIEFVRIVDIPGSGNFVDAAGSPIYDPFPTPLGSGGFDLEAVGVINATIL